MHMPFVVSRITSLTVSGTGEGGLLPTLVLDEELMRQTGLKDFQVTLVISEENRFEVMVRSGKAGTGEVELKGKQPLGKGDAFELVVQVFLDEREMGAISTHHYHVDENNQVVRVLMGRI